MMETLNYARIANKELQTYATKVKTIFSNALLSVEATEDVQFLQIPFSHKVDAFETAGLSGTTTYTGSGKKELDTDRDSSFLGLRGMVSTFKHSPNPEQVVMAESLELIIRKHGWNLNTEPYAKQSASTRNLLSDIDNNFTAEELKLIFADTWVSTLKENQQSFEDYTLNLNKGKANKGISQSDLKRELIVACNELVDYLPYLIKKVSDPNVKVLMDAINKLIIDTNAIIKSRETKAAQQLADAAKK